MRNIVIITPTKNVKVTHIQKRGCGIFVCIFRIGINGTKALATPCTKSPENGLLPEIARIHEKRKEYPTVSRIKPPKFM